jgi:hypothetical protein
MQFSALIRLAGLDVGLLIMALALLVGLVIAAWEILRILLVTALLAMLLPLAFFARALGFLSEAATESERDPREKGRQKAERFIADTFQLSDGGRYGRQGRWNRAVSARRADPDFLNHLVVGYLPGRSRNVRRRGWPR